MLIEVTNYRTVLRNGVSYRAMLIGGNVVWEEPVDIVQAFAAFSMEDGGYRGTTLSVNDTTKEVGVTFASAHETVYFHATAQWMGQWFFKVTGVLNKPLVVNKAVVARVVGGSNLNQWQGAWAYDPDGDWNAFEDITLNGSTVILKNTTPCTQDTVYVAVKPQFTNGRWLKAIARWRANPLTSKTISGNDNFVVATLPPVPGYTPAMDLYGFKFGTGPDAITVTGMVHPEEHTAGYAYEAFVDWLLGDSVDAIRLRQCCTFYCYPRSNPQSQYAGATRLEMTSKDNANRIFLPDGTMDNVPLSKMYRDVWNADLPSIIYAPFDFHDVPANPSNSAYMYANPVKNPISDKVKELYLARTGVTIRVDSMYATSPAGAIQQFMINEKKARFGIVPEHNSGKDAGIVEWKKWGLEQGRALAAHYPTVVPAGVASDWNLITQAMFTFGPGQVITFDEMGNYVVRAESSATPNAKAALTLPVGNKYELILDGGVIVGGGPIFARQASAITIASATALWQVQIATMNGNNGYYRGEVTPTVEHPYFGLIHGQQSYPGEIWVSRACRYRIIP